MLKLSALLYLRNSYLKRGERSFVAATYLQMGSLPKIVGNVYSIDSYCFVS